MSQRERIFIICIGVIIGVLMGLIYKDMYKCLLIGVITSSAITIMLNQKAKKKSRVPTKGEVTV